MIASRKLVIECLVSCFSSEQAGGFETADNADEDWCYLEPDISEVTDSGFIFHLGSQCFRVRVNKYREDKK